MEFALVISKSPVKIYLHAGFRSNSNQTHLSRIIKVFKSARKLQAGVLVLQQESVPHVI